MKVQYRSYGATKYDDGTTTRELHEYLKPTNTGSNQGTIEQLEAELSVCRETIGKLLAIMVERSVLSIEDAEDCAGIHESYKQYRYPNFKLIRE